MPLLLEQIMPPAELALAIHKGIPGAEPNTLEKSDKFEKVYGDALKSLPLLHHIIFLTALSYVEDFLQKSQQKEQQ